MKRKTVLGLAVAGIILLLTSTGTLAESSEFSNELSLGIVNSETSEDNDGNTSEGTAVNLEYSYYFKPVKNEKYPIAEAAFVERVPVISVGYMNSESELKSKGMTILEGDWDQLDLSYTHRSSSYPILLKIGTNHARADYNYALYSNLSGELKMDSFGFFAGYYIQEAMRFGIGYERGEYEFSFSRTYDEYTYDWDTIELEYKYVALFDQGSAMDFTLSYQTTNYDYDDESTKSKTAAVWLTYYFNRMIGVGLIVDKTSGDEGKYQGRSTTLSGNFYINNNLSFLVAYVKTDPDSDDYGDGKVFLANANYKF